MIYLTSDLYLGHKKYFGVNRPWNNVPDMDRNLIASINYLVGISDTLYILGDFSTVKDYSKLIEYRERINCLNVHLIMGDHDRYFDESNKKSPFESTQDYLELYYGNRLFCLSHYPFISWRDKDKGSIMCHGHIHSKSRDNQANRYKGDRRYDVGVDANLYKPVLIDDIIDFCN